MRANKSGRPLTTGRYKTRQELVDAVHYYYHYTPLLSYQICDFCRIGVHVLGRILKKETPTLYVHEQGIEHLRQQRTGDYDAAIHRMAVSAD